MKLVERNCRHCAKIYQAKAAEINRGQGYFCSKSCYLKSRRKIDKVISCIFCGNNKHITTQAAKNSKFCSRECYGFYTKKIQSQKKKECLLCKEYIDPFAGNFKRRVYCSINCASSHQQIKRRLNENRYGLK